MSLAPAAAIRIGTVDVHGVTADTRLPGPLSGPYTSLCGITADNWSLLDYFAFPAPGLECCEACLAQTVGEKP